MPSGGWSSDLLSHPEVVSVSRRTGRAELDEHAQGVEAAELDVALRMRERRKAALLDALRRDFSLIPGMNITIGQPISHRIDHMLSGTRANIAVKIFGEDLYTRGRWGKGPPGHGDGAGRRGLLRRAAARYSHAQCAL